MSEWKEEKLADLVVLDREQLPGSTQGNYNFYYIDISSVSTNKIDLPSEPITFRNAPSRARKVLNHGDVLVSTVRPNLKGFARFKQPSAKRFVASTGFAVLSEKNGTDLGYVYQYILSDSIERQIESLVVGSNYPAINTRELKGLRVNIPTLPTQRKIAHILSTIDGQIEKTEAIISKYQAVKQGMLQDLFTRGIDVRTGQLRPRYEDAPELYQKSALVMIPKEWAVKQLNEVADYVDYRGKTPPKSEVGIFLVTAKNVKEGYIDYEASQEYIPEATFASVMSRGTAEVGDVLITTEAPMGNVAQVNRANIALAQRVIKYRGKTGIIENGFLRLVLMSRSFQDALIADSSGSTVTGIKGSRLHKMKIITPNLTEQQHIKSIAESLEKRLESEQRSLSKLYQLKQGMMQDLLSGKVAVTA